MVRFLIGSSLVFLGTMVMASAALTVIGLPLGLVVFAAGLQLLLHTRGDLGRPSSPREGG
jgi:hypothetical protein